MLQDHNACRAVSERQVCQKQWMNSMVPRQSSDRFWLSLPNVVAPFAQGFDDLWEHGCSKWHPDEDEGFVDEVGEAELGPDCCVTCKSMSELIKT